jgi:hypothetical protein
MEKLFAAVFACALAAPALAAASETAPNPQLFLRETAQVTARAELVYKPSAAEPAVDGKAEVVEHSRGLVVYDPAVATSAKPASPVQTTTTETVSWTPVRTLPTPRSF